MFIRVKDLNSRKERNINIDQIVDFEPLSKGDSMIHLVGGRSVNVEESNRTLRHLIKEAQAPKVSTTESPAEA